MKQENEFVLPEKWKIKWNKEVGEYYAKKSDKVYLDSWTYLKNINNSNQKITDDKYKMDASFSAYSGLDWEEITFDQFKEHVLKEPNGVYSNSEFNSESKIIGYKLIKEEYKEAFSKLMDIDVDYIYSTDDEPYHFSVDCTVEDKMIKLNLIDVWCEKIYAKSITLKSGKVLTASEIEEVKEILKNK